MRLIWCVCGASAGRMSLYNIDHCKPTKKVRAARDEKTLHIRCKHLKYQMRKRSLKIGKLLQQDENTQQEGRETAAGEKDLVWEKL